MNKKIEEIARSLREAEASRQAIPPFGAGLAGDLAAAYAVQTHNVKARLAGGERIVGRKIGLTSKAVQAQLGVDQPDYGTLFSTMEILHGDSYPADVLIKPRVEAEIAIVLDRDLPAADLTMSELIKAVAFVVPAIEIVDSRVADWKIGILDTIADNGSSARFVVGLEPRKVDGLDLEMCGMALSRNGTTVSVGSGAACLGHPLRAALWLARTMAQGGTPLKAGEVLLTGALGPMSDVRPGDHFEARISGFAPVRVQFG